MKIIITGAHFTTAVAVIDELRKYDVRLVYVGRQTTREGDNTPSVESQEIPKLGVKFIPVTTGRLQRDFTFYTIPSLLKIPIGFIQSFFILLKEKPDIILSFGGYVAVPLVVVGWLWSIPIIIHEQTLVSGLANRISALFADKICVSFPQNYSSKKKIILTGNPIRQEIINPGTPLDKEFGNLFKKALEKKLPVILITCGNQGSHSINLAVEGCLEKLLKIACVIHQTGDSKFQDFERLSTKQQENYLPKKWIGVELGTILSKVDLVVSRAGINTLLENTYYGVPTLAIPIQASNNEQRKNAKFFQTQGLVNILTQKELSGESLYKNIKSMITNLDKLKINAKNSKGLVIPDAAKRVAIETVLIKV